VRPADEAGGVAAKVVHEAREAVNLPVTCVKLTPNRFDHWSRPVTVLTCLRLVFPWFAKHSEDRATDRNDAANDAVWRCLGFKPHASTGGPTRRN
jgi:hypothetical protein